MINATILIQILNFIAAYILLKEIVLKPALDLIEREKEAYEMLKIRVQEHEKVLLEHEKIKNMQQRTFTQALRQMSPNLKNIMIPVRLPAIQSFELTAEEKEQLVARLSTMLVKGVFHD